MDSSRAGHSCLLGRRLSHGLASTSGRDAVQRRGRSRLKVRGYTHPSPPRHPLPQLCSEHPWLCVVYAVVSIVAG